MPETFLYDIVIKKEGAKNQESKIDAKPLSVLLSHVIFIVVGSQLEGASDQTFALYTELPDSQHKLC